MDSLERVKIVPVALVAVLSCTACTHVNRATLVASTAALVVDWRYTRGNAQREWHCGGRQFYESNPVMGWRPSTGAVDLYFAAAAALNTAVWVLMPSRYKSAVPVGVLALQAGPIMGNLAIEERCSM